MFRQGGYKDLLSNSKAKNKYGLMIQKKPKKILINVHEVLKGDHRLADKESCHHTTYHEISLQEQEYIALGEPIEKKDVKFLKIYPSATNHKFPAK